jgi:hypothetical protein
MAPVLLDPCFERVKQVTVAWISTVRPSRQPFRGFLRMRRFQNATKEIPQAEECPKSLPQARTGGASRSTHNVDAGVTKGYGSRPYGFINKITFPEECG